MLITPFEDEIGTFRDSVPEPDVILKDVKVRDTYIWHRGPNGPTEPETVEVSMDGPISFEDALKEWEKALTASAERTNAQERNYYLEGVHETIEDDGTLVFDLRLGT